MGRLIALVPYPDDGIGDVDLFDPAPFSSITTTSSAGWVE